MLLRNLCACAALMLRSLMALATAAVSRCSSQWAALRQYSLAGAQQALKK
jgi:hypothetical protein